MEPLKVNKDVKEILSDSVSKANELREQANEKILNMLRVVARIYGVSVDKAMYLKLVELEDGELYVFDSRIHTFVEGKFVELPQPTDPE